MACRLHPDVGGSHQRLLAANLAYEAAHLWAEEHDAGVSRTGAA